jgi:hypothetical protein
VQPYIVLVEDSDSEPDITSLKFETENLPVVALSRGGPAVDGLFSHVVSLLSLSLDVGRTHLLHGFSFSSKHRFICTDMLAFLIQPHWHQCFHLPVHVHCEERLDERPSTGEVLNPR